MSTLLMVKTVCCEAYKECGKRCSLCPHLPENRANVARYQRAAAEGLGRRLRDISDAARPASSDVVASPDFLPTRDIDVTSGC
jgi:hypothetical protein